MGRVAEKLAKEAGFETTFIELNDYPFPLLNQDETDRFEFPESVLEAKKLLSSHDAFLFLCGEYNASIPAALKNFIDWTSRASSKDERPGTCYNGKVAGLMSASPSPFGGLRAVLHLREILSILSVFVIPQDKVIPVAHEAFKEHTLSDTHLQGMKKSIDMLYQTTKKLRH
jgi:NAD(P)H-dependent FMN reductase